MNFADRMKAQQTEVTITKREYSKACVDAMQRILEDEQCEIMFEVMPRRLWMEAFKLYAVAVREELFGGDNDDR